MTTESTTIDPPQGDELTEAERAIIAESDRRLEWVAGLRRIADWYAAHPELIPAHGKQFEDYTVPNDTTERDRAIAYAKALGTCDKDASTGGTLFVVRSKPGRFGPHHVAYFATRSEVCTKRETEVERVVTERDPEAVEAALATIPAVERTVTETVVEWDCPPSLLALADD